jgi:peptide/nickel transport system permease protein
VRRFIAARLAQSAIIVIVVTVVAFLLIRLAPGEPFSYTAPNMTPALRAQWREQFGYNKPIGVQLVRYLTNVAHGNLGYSTLQRRPVREAIADALPRTLMLAGVGLVASFILGIGLGALAAAKRRSWWDRVIVLFCTVTYSIPDFWLALVVQLGLAYWIRLFPVSGTADPLIQQYGGGWLAFTDRIRHLALPVFTITLVITSIVARFQRAALIDVLPSDYVRTARAKGASERTVIARHALRNALTPTITVLGLLFPTVLGGAFFIEYVFGWHGLGWLAINSVEGLDYDVATGGVIVAGVIVTLGSLLADILAAIADPRVRDG